MKKITLSKYKILAPKLKRELEIVKRFLETPVNLDFTSKYNQELNIFHLKIDLEIGTKRVFYNREAKNICFFSGETTTSYQQKQLISLYTDDYIYFEYSETSSDSLNIKDKTKILYKICEYLFTINKDSINKNIAEGYFLFSCGSVENFNSLTRTMFRDIIGSQYGIEEGILKQPISINSYYKFGVNINSDKVFYHRKDNQTVMRLGKGIKKFLGLLNIENDSNKLKNIVDRIRILNTPCELEVVEGEDITKYYHHSMYAEDNKIGTLADSCMRHSRCVDYFGMYEDYAKMLILKNPVSGKIEGRALLWVADCGTKIMDRVYSNEKNRQLFFDWANENGYYRKHRQTYDDYNTFCAPNRTNKEYLSFNINVSSDFLDDYFEFPYVDTFFRFVQVGRDSYLTNSTDENYDAELRDVDGDYENY